MTDKPQDESAGEQPHGDKASSGDQEPDSTGAPEEGEPDGEATDDLWNSISPEARERFTEAMRAHLPDFGKMLRDQFSALIPDMAAIVQPQMDLLRDQVRNLVPALAQPEMTSVFPLIDFSKIVKPLLPDLSAIMPKLVMPDISEGLRALLQQLKEKMPPNWPQQADYDLVFRVIQDEGIPLVWVPRPEIVADLLAAPDRDARVEVLTSRSAEVAQDCREALDHITLPELVSMLPMAISAVDAYADGHHAPPRRCPSRW